MPPRPSEPREELRERLVAATVALLEQGGPSAVSVRAVARAAGTSTMAVYSRVGDMPGLVDAVSEAGFELLRSAFAAMERSDDAVADVLRLALVYRRFAHERTHLFDLMFGLSAPGGYRPTAARAQRERSPAFLAAFEQLMPLARRLMDEGRVAPGHDPEVVVAQLWSLAHGFICLELAGHLSSLEDPVAEVLGGLGSHLVVGLGGDPEATDRSQHRVLMQREPDDPLP